MSLPVTPVYCLIALVPVLFLLFTVMALGWGVAKAAPFAMIMAAITSVVFYRSDISALVFEAGKGLWSAATILLVIWPAVFSYEMTCESHGFEAIRDGIQRITRHELLQILILGWVFPSFLQGITGFGVAVAVGAPLLLSIGVTPFYSIVIILLCHCWGATFGTLALAWEALVAQAGMSALQNAQAAFLAAAMLWLFNIICVMFCCWLYGRMAALKEIFPVLLILSIIMGGGELLLAPVNSTISFFLPCAAALGAAIIICRRAHWKNAWAIKASPIMERKENSLADNELMNFHHAFLPYYLLTLITLVCLLCSPVNRLLVKVSIAFSFPRTATGYGFVTEAVSGYSPVKPLTYAGTFLALSSLITFCFYRYKGYIRTEDLKNVWRRTVKKCIGSTQAIICLIVMSKFLSSSGQIHVLSQAIVKLLGTSYVIAAPFFGMLGSFITSSNMSSNILLSSLQSTAANILNINPAVTSALQTVGGVLGDAFAPGCVIMGISTTGYAGAESRILKHIVPISALFGLAFGLYAFLFMI